MITDVIDTEGFLKDRILDGILKRFIDLDGIRRGDIKAIEDMAKLVLSFIGPDLGDEADEVFDIVREVLKETRDPWAIIYEVGDALVKIAGPRRNVPPVGSIVALGTQRVETFTTAQAKQYLSDHRATVREAQDQAIGGRFLRRRFKDAPEVLAALKGESHAEAISPERLDQIMEIIRRAVPWLTFAGAAFPYLIIVAQVLKMILARYDVNHPKLPGEAVGTADIGLNIADFA